MNIEAAVQVLADAGVDFIIIEGWCAILHGSDAHTYDLDVFFSREPGNLERLVRALAPYRPRLRDLPAGLPFLGDQAALRNGTIFTLSTDLGAIDLLAEVTGLASFAEVREESVAVEAFGRRVQTLDLKSLIKATRQAVRRISVSCPNWKACSKQESPSRVLTQRPGRTRPLMVHRGCLLRFQACFLPGPPANQNPAQRHQDQHDSEGADNRGAGG